MDKEIIELDVPFMCLRQFYTSHDDDDDTAKCAL